MAVDGSERAKSTGVRNFFHNLFDIRDDMMTYDELREMMEGDHPILCVNLQDGV